MASSLSILETLEEFRLEMSRWAERINTRVDLLEKELDKKENKKKDK